MSQHKAPPLSGQIIEEASEWFVEFNAGEVRQPDREAFVDWLKRSPEHIRAYLQVTANWEDAGALAKTSVPPISELVHLARGPANGNVVPIGAVRSGEGDASAGAVTRTSNGLPHVSGQTQRMRKHVLAASLVLALIGVSGLYWFERERGIYATEIGEQRSIRLGDGSTVELNAHSRMRVILRAQERDVELIEGQALFRVAKDHSRPFVVHSGGTNVLAVGTQFDVNRRRSGTTVTVVEGRVAVFPAVPPGSAADWSKAVPAAHPAPRAQSGARDSGSALVSAAAEGMAAHKKGEIYLAAGEQLTVSGASVQIAANTDVALVTAWTQKQIIFNSTPLYDVVDEFNRYSTRPLVITDPAIASTRISGEFASGSPDSLLKGLAGLNRFTIRETPGRIEISGR